MRDTLKDHCAVLAVVVPAKPEQLFPHLGDLPHVKPRFIHSPADMPDTPLTMGRAPAPAFPESYVSRLFRGPSSHTLEGALHRGSSTRTIEVRRAQSAHPIPKP